MSPLSVIDTFNTGVLKKEVEYQGLDVEVLPNPSSGSFVIRSEFEIESLEIFDMLGKLINEKEVGMSEYLVRDLPSGLYILNLRTAGKMYSFLHTVK